MLGHLAALQAQGLSQKSLGQAATGVTVRTGGAGNQPARELGIEPVGPTGPGVAEDGLEGMVVMEPLKEQIPEGDQWGKEPFIEGELLEGRQLAEGAVGQQLEEKAQQLSRGEGGRRFRGWWFWGVFFDGS